MGKAPKDTGGPVVKTGPTAGKNRSRNKNGQWRKKRGDSGKPKKSGGCFLTTAACDYKGLADNCRELIMLRDFRDNYLQVTDEGRTLVERYYRIAPVIVRNIESNTEFEYIWRVICRCVQNIEEDQPEKALINYRAMTESLEAKYL